MRFRSLQQGTGRSDVLSIDGPADLFSEFSAQSEGHTRLRLCGQAFNSQIFYDDTISVSTQLMCNSALSGLRIRWDPGQRVTARVAQSVFRNDGRGKPRSSGKERLIGGGLQATGPAGQHT